MFFSEKISRSLYVCVLGAILQCGTVPAVGLAQKAPSQPTSSESSTHKYVIGAADVLQIVVAGEPDASMASVTVRSDGLISMPLVKDISVAGLTPKELEQLITKKLSALIREPDVSVYVKEIHSERVYVLGAVRKEGSINLDRPLTVLQAISEAGGLTDYAKRNRIYVLHQQDGKQTRYPFDYNAVIRNQRPEQNITLGPGDTVVVP